MLSAMSSGHDGSLSTVHAGSPEEALRRVETLALMAGLGLPHEAIREQVAGALDLVVHQARMPDGARRVVAVSEVVRVAGGAGDARALRAARRPPARGAPRSATSGRPPAAASAEGGVSPAGPRSPASPACARCSPPGRRSRPPSRSAPCARRRRWLAPALDVLRSGREPTSPERRRLVLVAALSLRGGRMADRRTAAPRSALGPTAPWLARAVLRARSARRRAAIAAEAPADRARAGGRARGRALGARRARRRGRTAAASRVRRARSCGPRRPRSSSASARTTCCGRSRGVPATGPLRHARRRGPAAARRRRRPRRAAARRSRPRSRPAPGSSPRRARRPPRRVSPRWLVTGLPFAGLALAELVAPGFLLTLASTPLSAVMIVAALGLQVVALRLCAADRAGGGGEVIGGRACTSRRRATCAGRGWVGAAVIGAGARTSRRRGAACAGGGWVGAAVIGGGAGTPRARLRGRRVAGRGQPR